MRRVVIFLKVPTPGAVKTRLGATIGTTKAAEIYGRLIDLTLEALRGEADVELRIDPPGGEQWAVGLRRQPTWTVEPQGDGGLGERLWRSVQAGFDAGYGRVLVIGSDCPEIEAGDLKAADAALDNVDVVFGPARDGGFWLLGVRRGCPNFLNDVRWSSEQTLTDSLRGASDAGLTYSLLRELSDIDTAEDLQRFSGRFGLSL